eukprot:Gregarina_sp_Pseudo_9__5535@NODE_729_length_2308_cov_11_174967_g685_i0_p1_GENE_NODE_729_length_2308_cov_11_174967_g685_i0NODE_729_length_2308_cov_11_174967_g685_i0_p1_ORF_typecomplete_len519_score64_97PS_Dcarbxylase/PF02666_15/7_5e55_NODE_729_length_2308_cov_11_174967_g685_i06912247
MEDETQEGYAVDCTEEIYCPSMAGSTRENRPGTRSSRSTAHASIRPSTRTLLLKCCFGKTRSRLTGAFMRLNLPFRQTLFRSLLSTWRQDEGDLDTSLESFDSLSEFFSRRLKPSARPVESMAPCDLVSPCDGTLAHYERIETPSEIEWLTQLKGAKYKVSKFLGRHLESQSVENLEGLCVSRFEAPVRYCPVCNFPQILEGIPFGALPHWSSSSRQCRMSGVTATTTDKIVISSPEEAPLKDYIEQQSTASHSTRDHISATTFTSSPLPSSTPATLPVQRRPSSVISDDAPAPSLDPLTPGGGEEDSPDTAPVVWHYFVIYLAPSDYHHFHSPTELTFYRRRHFAGEVMPVCRSVASRLNNLFAVNERVVLEGSWRYGQFFYVPISAYNVADIRLTFEPSFGTNLPKSAKGPSRGHCHLFDYLPDGDAGADLHLDVSREGEGECTHLKQHLRHPQTQKALGTHTGTHDGVHLQRGDEVGEFRLGSTVVLLFQGPANMRIFPAPGDHLKMGQLLARFA